MIKTDIVRTVATLTCTFVVSATFILAAVAPAHQAPATRHTAIVA